MIRHHVVSLSKYAQMMFQRLEKADEIDVINRIKEHEIDAVLVSINLMREELNQLEQFIIEHKTKISEKQRWE